MVPVGGGQHLTAVMGFADDLHRGPGEHHRQPGRDQGIVVGKQYPDRAGHGCLGMVARNTKSPMTLGPCS